MWMKTKSHPLRRKYHITSRVSNPGMLRFELGTSGSKRGSANNLKCFENLRAIVL
jgi:hypothetical protein